MELKYLLDELPDACVEGDRDIQLGQIRCDSRCVEEGDFFVAVRGGQEQDRHRFVDHAIARGARAVMVEERIARPGVTQVQVADCRAALARMAARFYAFPGRGLLNVGVTGTNGKTTTAFLLRNALEAAGLPCGYLGTLGFWCAGALEKMDNTTPEAVQLHGFLRRLVDAGMRVAVLEVSSHGLALKRVEGIPFQAAIFTNLTRDHLDFHGTWDAYFAAKARLFEGLQEGAIAVLNADDAHADELARRTQARVVTYGCGPEAEVRLQRAEVGPQGTHLSLDTPAGPIEVQTQLIGPFNYYNTMAVVATGLALNLNAEALARGVAALARVPGRCEPISEGQDFAVVVDYAHTPDALERVLQAARSLGSGRLICVCGCGGDRDRGKRSLMGRVAGEQADWTVLTADNPRSEDPQRIMDEMAAGMPDPSAMHREVDRAAAIAVALGAARRGDVVVIAGKGHEQEQELADRVVAFDDREVARRVLRDLCAGERPPLCAP